MDALQDLIERLADRGTTDDYDQPAVDLGFDRRQRTPYPILRWTPAHAAAEGERVAAKLAGRGAPPSLLRVMRAYGPVQVHESVIEGAIGEHWPHVPLDQIEGLESYDVAGGGDLPWIGERRARGVVVRARWDDPQVIGCTDLSRTDEPIWLLFAPIDPGGDDAHLMPLASSYDEVLLLHLTGIDLALAMSADAFDRALGEIHRLEPALVPFVTQALEIVDRTATAFSDRADVHMRNSDADDVRSPGLDDGAARVRARVRRMREAIAKT